MLIVRVLGDQMGHTGANDSTPRNCIRRGYLMRLEIWKIGM